MFRMRPLSIPGMLALLVLLVVPVSHYAQAEVARAGNDPNVPPAAKPDADIAHKLELLEEQMRAQNGRIDQLTALVAEQQRLINQLVAARVSNTNYKCRRFSAEHSRFGDGTRRLDDNRCGDPESVRRSNQETRRARDEVWSVPIQWRFPFAL